MANSKLVSNQFFVLGWLPIDKIEQVFYNGRISTIIKLEVPMNISQSINSSFFRSLSRVKARKDVMYVFITILALVAFEAFNFSTTDFALSDLLGDLRFVGIRWATLLSIAFCGIDFAGIARLFTPQKEGEEPPSVWYLFGAWFLAATMNAILTWWGVVMAMQTHNILSADVVGTDFINSAVPIFIALMVWVIRVLLIGTLSKKGDRLLQESQKPAQVTMSRREFRQAQSRAAHAKAEAAKPIPMGFSSVSRKKSSSPKPNYRPEPRYIPMQEEPFYHSMKDSRQSQQRR
jgi:hypothetical protein